MTEERLKEIRDYSDKSYGFIDDLLTYVDQLRAELLASEAARAKAVEALATLHDEVIPIQSKGPRGWDSHLKSAIRDASDALAAQPANSQKGD